MINKELWEKCYTFHGHICPGLAIGFKIATYAQELLNMDFSTDEEIVCITENDSCSLDAIQVITGCTAGKGNLIFHLTGKQAYSFYNRENSESVRIILKKIDRDLPRDEMVDFILESEYNDILDVKDTHLELPKKAEIFKNIECSKCLEETAEAFITFKEGKPYCLDCLKG